MCKNSCYCNLIEDFDMFGREAKLYYKGKEKKTTYIGNYLSVLYLIFYISFFIYKLIKMLKKVDVVFYDTFTYEERPPSINLSADNFYGGFGLESPDTYDPFIDETIYFPKAYFKSAIRSGSEWDWEVKELELEKCNISKFGEFYRDKFSKNVLENLYCFKDMNETLNGHFSYDNYSFFYIQFFPCINTTENNNHCQPPEVIDNYLRSTFISMEFEDIELNPHNYSYPVSSRNQDIYFTVGKKLFKEVHIFYQIINIETDLEVLGIEELGELKNEQFLKYHSTYQMSNIIEENIYETGEPFCDISIKLYDQIRTQKRVYPKLISVLGDVGGFMEVVFSFFSLSSFFIDKLYEISIFNELFKFNNYKKKQISYKFIQFNTIKSYNDNFAEKKNLKKNRTMKRDRDEEGKKKETEKEKEKEKIKEKPKEKEKIRKVVDNQNIASTERKINLKKSLTFTNQKKIDIKTRLKKMILFKINNENKDFQINLSELMRYYLFCFCLRNRENNEKEIFEQGMELFSTKMDIFNLFKESVKIEPILKMNETINSYNNLDIDNDINNITSKS